MNYGSLFTGAGGGDIGLDRAGMTCRWQCEIDKACRSVLSRHWPDKKRYDDITKIKKKPMNVDVIIGGSPCQGFSVAGERGGMEDERSLLFQEMVRVVAAVKPKYVIWENVPGVLSGYDEVLADEHYELFSWSKRRALAVEAGGLIRRWWLGAVLRSFANIGYGGAYRIIDSQHFGVPQRRRRIFAVFSRGVGSDSGTDRCRQILSFGQSVSRNPATGKEAGKEVAFSFTASVGRNREGNRIGNAWNTNYVAGNLAPCLRGSGVGTERIGDSRGQDCVVPVLARALTTSNQRIDAETETLITHTLRGEGFDASEDGMGRGTPLVPVAYRTSGNCGAWATGDRTDALNTGTDPNQTVIAYQCQGSNVGEMGTLRSGNGNSSGGVPFMAFSSKDYGADAGELSPTLRAMGHTGSHANAGGQGVRRLTPRECERLQGWPDDHTRFDANGKEIADGPRYRMIGNGMTSNVIQWIGTRMMEIESK